MKVIFPDDCRPWLEEIQSHGHAQPERAIGAARQLLKRCTAPAHLAYAWEQLGFAHLLLGEHRLSCLFYTQALALQPDNYYVLANLAHAQYELGEREAAVHHGREALRLKDLEACRAAPPPEPLQAPYRGPVNLLSFSLFGRNPRYCEMAVLNVLAARRHLPDFICRFHVDDSVPCALIARLEKLGAQCRHLGPQATTLPATCWRFLAIDDPQADCVVVRDVDALIDARDAWCVQDWRDSSCPFHILRDDCCHTELILAGLFGVRAGTVRRIASRIADFLQVSGTAGWQRYGDQLFLRSCLWPLVGRHALTHDRIYGYGARAQAIEHVARPARGPHGNFIGANHATCKIECELAAPPPAGACARLSITDQAGELVCRYAMQQVPGTDQWRAYLPQVYLKPLESGHWRHEIALVPEHQAGIGEGSVADALLDGA